MKVRTHKSRRHRYSKAWQAHGHIRAGMIAVEVEVQRRGRGFIACANVRRPPARYETAKSMLPWGGPRGYYCAAGRNPRKASAGALRKVAATLAKRSGAFAGAR